MFDANRYRYRPLDSRNIIVTASTNKKLEYCKSLGATHGINYKEVPNWEAKVKEITNNRGVDVIIDFVAGSYFKKNMEAAAVDCRTVMLALLGGPKVDPDINLGLMLFKRLRIQGSTLRTRSLPYQIELTKRLRKDVFPKLISGELKNVIDTVYDWKDIAKAHEHLEADKTLGKVGCFVCEFELVVMKCKTQISLAFLQVVVKVSKI